MSTPKEVRRALVLVAMVAIVATVAARPLAAQQAASSPTIRGPVAGEWAAEAALGSGFDAASLIHFSSARRAWVMGLTATGLHTTIEDPIAHTSHDVSLGLANLQLGMRQYSGADAVLRPYWGLGALGDLENESGVHTWMAGAYAEFGAAYFLAPHFSVGADGRLDGKYQHQKTAGEDGAELIGDFGLVRLTAAVYF